MDASAHTTRGSGCARTEGPHGGAPLPHPCQSYWTTIRTSRDLTTPHFLCPPRLMRTSRPRMRCHGRIRRTETPRAEWSLPFGWSPWLGKREWKTQPVNFMSRILDVEWIAAAIDVMESQGLLSAEDGDTQAMKGVPVLPLLARGVRPNHGLQPE